MPSGAIVPPSLHAPHRQPAVIAPNATLIGEAETGANPSLQAGGPTSPPAA